VIRVAAALAVAAVAGPARAADLACGPVEAGVIHVDGILEDWEGVEGLDVGGRDPDLSFTARCNYDAQWLYLAVDVRDDYLARTRDGRTGEDHVEIGFADGAKVDRLVIYPGDPSLGIRRVVRWSSGRPVKGVEIGDARLAHGWAVEARLKLAALPGWTPGAPILKMAIAVTDCDSRVNPVAKQTRATAPLDGPATLGVIEFPEARQSLDAFLRDRRLKPGDVWFDRVGHVAPKGSARVVVAGGYLAFVSDEYAYVALPIHDRRDLLDARLADLAGDGREAAVVRYLERAPNGTREVLGAFRMTGDGLRRTFGVEVGKSQGGNRLATRVSFIKKGRATEILVEALAATGWTEKTFREGRADDVVAIPTPWSTPPRARFRFKGDDYFRVE
jgi:hypothetical protein